MQAESNVRQHPRSLGAALRQTGAVLRGNVKKCVTLVESEEGWAVWCDSLPGCCSQGATRPEALANIRDAIGE